MKPGLIACVTVGLALGGIVLPALLHPFGVTVLFSEEDIIVHTLGGLIGILIGLSVWILKFRVSSEPLGASSRAEHS